MKTDDGAGARKPEVCPSCGATDNNPYTDANGNAMRACGRCMIQWRVAERGEVGSVGQGERAGDEWIIPEKVGSGEIGRRIQHFYEDDERAEAQPEAGAVTYANMCFDCASESDPCAKVLGTGKCRCSCHVAKRSVAPSVEELELYKVIDADLIYARAHKKSDSWIVTTLTRNI
jgi:hypothetical protein